MLGYLLESLCNETKIQIWVFPKFLEIFIFRCNDFSTLVLTKFLLPLKLVLFRQMKLLKIYLQQYFTLKCLKVSTAQTDSIINFLRMIYPELFKQMILIGSDCQLQLLSVVKHTSQFQILCSTKKFQHFPYKLWVFVLLTQ